MRRPFIVVVLLGLLALPLTPARAGHYSALYAFGDSLSDTGNALIATTFGALPGIPKQPVPPYFAGRFSNGPNWIDQLSARLGLGPAKPDLIALVPPGGQTGNVYATGLATIGPNPFAPINTIDYQVGRFLAAHPAAPSTALYTMWAGANDLLILLSQVTTGAAAAQLQFVLSQGGLGLSLATTLYADLAQLYGAGAREFLLVNMPDLGLTPRYRGAILADGTDMQAVATQVSQIFNGFLAQVDATLAGLPGSSVTNLDVFRLYRDAAGNPGQYGFTNVIDSCLQPTPVNYANPPQPPGGVCGSPQTYLSWDDIHPTSTTHAIIASAALAALPEPASIALLLVAAGGLAVLRRRA